MIAEKPVPKDAPKSTPKPTKINPFHLCKRLLRVPYTPAVLHSVTKSHSAAIVHLKADAVRADVAADGLTCFVLRKMANGIKARKLTGTDRDLSRDVLRMFAKQDISGVLIVPHRTRFTDRQVIEGLRDGGALVKVDPVRSSTAPDANEAEKDTARPGYNRDLMLGSKVKFGKYSPRKIGRQVTWKYVIDNHPGYIKWAFKGISPAFLHVTALRYHFNAGGHVPKPVQDILAEHGNTDEGWKVVGNWLSSV